MFIFHCFEVIVNNIIIKNNKNYWCYAASRNSKCPFYKDILGINIKSCILTTN